MKRLKLYILTACIATALTACGGPADVPNAATNDTTVTNITAVADSEEADKTVQNNYNDSKQPDVDNSFESSLPPFEVHGKLAVEGTKIVDEGGNPFQLKGVSTHGIAWFPQYVNADAFATIRNDWKANCIRIAMYSDENNGYCSGGNKDKLKQLVKDGVQYATDLGMYVIIDWHVLGEHDPNVHKDEAKLFFQEMSSLYADYDNVLYEICNEPNGNIRWLNVKEYAEEIIPVIKANNPDAMIIVGTPTWSQDVDMAAKLPITDYSNILYTIHFYADTHKDDLRRKAKTALSMNLPLFCSEFGICDASGNGHCNEAEANKWIDFFDENDISYCIWNLSNKNESSSLIKSSCGKTSGWSEDDLSQEGKWYLNVLGRNATNDATKSTDTTADKSGKSADASDELSKNDNVVTTSSGSSNLKITASEANSWNDGTNDFVQLNLLIDNNDTSSDATGWTIAVEFEDDIELDQSWNAVYRVKRKTMIITPVDYNKTIGKGASVSDVGFIVKGTKIPKVAKISIN